MMVLVIVVVVIEMMSICWYLRAVMVAPHEITLSSTFPLVRVNRHTWSMSKVKMMELEIFHRWSRFCAILCKRDEPRHLPWQKSSDGIISKNVFFHLLTIRRSAKAVFCDRRHLLKFSLQQDLWTKIITNFVFQSFRLCSRTALQVLSTDYTVTIVAEKLERGGFCFCLGRFVYSSTSNVDLNNHTGHIYRTRCTDMQKNISAQVQTLHSRVHNPK